MRVLLVNPNTFYDPPTPPIGLEYLLTYLRANGHEAEILDLCFSEAPQQEINQRLKNKKYDLIGVTIRNIDNADFLNTIYFLEDIKIIVNYLKQYTIPIVLGGIGFSDNPKNFLDYFGADFGIYGPGEQAILHLIEDIKAKKANYRLLNGWDFKIQKELIHKRGEDVDYSRYVNNGADIGFETQKGCPNRCSYCIESKTGHWLKSIPNIIAEIKHLVQQGYSQFNLCDSEFNLDLTHSITFCRTLRDAHLNIKWSLLMKPVPYNEELFRLLKESNADKIYYCIESDQEQQKAAHYNLKDLNKIFEYGRKYDLQLSFNLLTGFPFEPRDSIEKMINFLKEKRPARVYVISYIRLYGRTKLTEFVKDTPELHDKLTRQLKQNENFMEPIFFNQINLSEIKKLIDGDEMFKVADG
ncbi:MAG: B12-binding domain-containing radical SAM protein [Candidatus Hodarchaeota archaeon]